MTILAVLIVAFRSDRRLAARIILRRGHFGGYFSLVRHGIERASTGKPGFVSLSGTYMLNIKLSRLEVFSSSPTSIASAHTVSIRMRTCCKVSKNFETRAHRWLPQPLETISRFSVWQRSRLRLFSLEPYWGLKKLAICCRRRYESNPRGFGSGAVASMVRSSKRINRGSLVAKYVRQGFIRALQSNSGEWFLKIDFPSGPRSLSLTVRQLASISRQRFLRASMVSRKYGRFLSLRCSSSTMTPCAAGYQLLQISS